MPNLIVGQGGFFSRPARIYDVEATALPSPMPTPRQSATPVLPQATNTSLLYEDMVRANLITPNMAYYLENIHNVPSVQAERPRRVYPTGR